MAGGSMDSASRRRPPNPFGDFAPSLNFYPSTSHRKVVHRVSRSLESGCGMMLLTGEIGIGKTSVSLFVQEKLSDSFAFVLLANPFLTPAGRVDAVLEQLQAPADVPRTMDGLEAWAVKMYRDGQPPVLILDECHLLQRESFSQLQVLSNLREGGAPLVQMLLVGQVEIGERLREPGMEAFNQRIGVRCEVEPMNLHDTREYVRFKLEKAEYPTPEVFEERAVERIWHISGGLPRLINHACSYALDQVTFCGLTRVTPRIVDDVVKDSMYRDLYGVRTKVGAAPWARAAVVAGLLACGAGAFVGVGHWAGWWGDSGRVSVAESGARQEDAGAVGTKDAAPQEDAAHGAVAVAARTNLSVQAGAAGGGVVAAARDAGGLASADGVVAPAMQARGAGAAGTRQGGYGSASLPRPGEGAAAANAQFSVNDAYADDPDIGIEAADAVLAAGAASAQGEPGALEGVMVPGAMPPMPAPAQNDVYVVVRPSGVSQGMPPAGAAPAHGPAMVGAVGAHASGVPGGDVVQGEAQGRQGAPYGEPMPAWQPSPTGQQPGGQAEPGAGVPGQQIAAVAGAVYGTPGQAGEVGFSGQPGAQAAAPPQAIPESRETSAAQETESIGSRVRDGGTNPVVGAVTVDAVAWSDNDEARIAVLDGHVLREGGALPSGVVLLRIGGEDLLLEYQGAIYRVAWNSQPLETER